MQFIEGGICAAQGFKAGAAMAGIKYADKYDVAVIASEFEASIAGVFTTNLVQAAPVLYSKEVTARGKARAIVVNSGNANACTGEQGMTDCRDMAKVTGKLLGVDAATVAVASTGVIGVPLPMAKVAAGVTAAAADLVAGNGHLAATAIMTTDTVAKEVAVEFFLQGTPVRLGGMAKGSGMIHPNMATMLGFVTTDAVIDAELLQLSLQEAAATTFNMITVDSAT
ncbi:MAG: bifunctional ornithine acetyltransferase/N-acetylglutamate synthase, partial [Peptococcaceae bacterium]|nr:bifunctional ornithine acetyltransferase/N-acetylglutamate synthase [Peptococcaceae bacterium]